MIARLRDTMVSASGRPSQGRVAAVVVLLLVCHFALAVLAVRDKSSTFDEVAHLTAGVYNWKAGDYRLVPEHPPFAHLWAALPVSAGNFKVPDANGPPWSTSDVWNLGRRFLYESGNDAQAVLLRGRAMIALLSVALGLLVWRWSRGLFGEAGGLLSLALYTFNPATLAHGALITTDMAASLFFLATVGTLWRVLHRVSAGNVVLSSLALAGLLLSKTSALLILPMAGVLMLVRLVSGRPTTAALRRAVEIRSRLGQAGVWLVAAIGHAVIAAIVIWGVYGFRYPAMRDGEPGSDRFFTPTPLPQGVAAWDYVLEGGGAPGRMIAWARDRRLLPESYLFGVAFTLRSAEVRSAFLNGENRAAGWWWFFPYCFAVKTPLALFGVFLMAAAAGIGVARREGFRNGLYRTAPLWVLFAVYWASAITSNLNIGHRHILPIYPVLFILCGRAADWLRRPERIGKWAVPILTVLCAAAALRVHPHYLAYFNLLASGPGNGYRHLVDSSLDWGQDLPGLKAWLDRNRPSTVYLSYFGSAPPTYYGIQAEALPSFLPWAPARWMLLTGGVYCISATTLQQIGLLPECRWTEALEDVYQDHRRRAGDGTGVTREELGLLVKLRFARLCAFLRQRNPDDRVGYSILIYHLTDEDVRRATDGAAPESAVDTPGNLARLAARSREAADLIATATFQGFLLRSADASIDSAGLDSVAVTASELASRGRVVEAVDLFRRGLAHRPDHVGLNNNLAWLLATTASAEHRNGAEAVRLAGLAAQATGGRDPSVLDTLAAAHAEAGHFDEAVRCAEQAVALARTAGQGQLAKEIARRLESYRSRLPWREP